MEINSSEPANGRKIRFESVDNDFDGDVDANAVGVDM